MTRYKDITKALQLFQKEVKEVHGLNGYSLRVKIHPNHIEYCDYQDTFRRYNNSIKNACGKMNINCIYRGKIDDRSWLIQNNFHMVGFILGTEEFNFMF